MVAVLAGVWLALAALLIACWRRLGGPSPALRYAALALVLALSVVHQLLFATVVEDAYTTFRYAANIADGNGPVFNAGVPAEGYSSFAWMVLLAFGNTLFGADIVATAVAIGALCTVGCVLVAYLLVCRVTADGDPEGRGTPALAVLAAASTASASSLAAFGPSGLPTALFLLLVLGVCYAIAAERPVVGGGLAALAMMTRPDGAVVIVVVAGWLLFTAARGRLSWWSPGGFLLSAAVLAAPWIAWQATYYGQLVPDRPAQGDDAPFGTGLEYLSGFALAHQGFLLLAVAAVGGLALRGQGTPALVRARGTVWLIVAITIAYLAVVTSFGGQWMPAWRLLVPVPPLLAVAAAATYGLLAAPVKAPTPGPRRPPLNPQRHFLPVVGMALCGLSLVVSVLHPAMLPALQDGRREVRQAGEIGGWLGRNLPPGTVISSFGNKALAYTAGPDLIVIRSLGAPEASPDGSGGQSGFSYAGDPILPTLTVATTGGYTAQQRCGIAPAYAGRYEVATFQRTAESSARWITLYIDALRAEGLIKVLDADPRFRNVPCV